MKTVGVSPILSKAPRNVSIVYDELLPPAEIIHGRNVFSDAELEFWASFCLTDASSARFRDNVLAQLLIIIIINIVLSQYATVKLSKWWKTPFETEFFHTVISNNRTSYSLAET